ncbi:hypothetical protein AAIA72_02180 [Hahella sp. SMD15-11]|uniref:6-bladed beta-propeller n=1 Tax=Thermohahella caldifontis TaxID=3142973 RepID=A0AB39UY69_9GAMM
MPRTHTSRICTAIWLLILTACTPDTWQERVKKAMEDGDPITEETFSLPMEDYTDPKQFDGPRLMFFGSSPWPLRYADHKHGLLLFSARPDGSDLRLVLTEEELYKDSGRSACCIRSSLHLARSPDNRYVAFELRRREDIPYKQLPPGSGGELSIWLVDLKTRQFTHVDDDGIDLKFTAQGDKLCYFSGDFKCYNIRTGEHVTRYNLKLRSAGFGFRGENNQIVNINPEQIEIYSFDGTLLQTYPFTSLFRTYTARRLVTGTSSSIVSENGRFAYILLTDGTGWLVDTIKGVGLKEVPDTPFPSDNILGANGDLYLEDRKGLRRVHGASPALPELIPYLSHRAPVHHDYNPLGSPTLTYRANILINQ